MNELLVRSASGQALRLPRRAAGKAPFEGDSAEASAEASEEGGGTPLSLPATPLARLNPQQGQQQQQQGE